MEKIKSILISRIFYSQTRGRHCAPLRTTIPLEPNCSKKKNVFLHVVGSSDQIFTPFYAGWPR